MTGRPAHWTDGIVGPHALTWWSWFLTLPVAMTAMNAFVAAPTTRDGVLGLVAILLAHLVLGALGMVLRPLIALPRSRRARLIAALAAFALLGAARPILVFAFPFEAAASMDTDLVIRVAMNVVTAVICLSAIAVLTDLVRRHIQTDRRLRAVLSTIETQLGFDEDSLLKIRANYAAQLATDIERALPPTAIEDLDSEEASRMLQTISDDVVRPLSHEAYADATPWRFEPPAMPAAESLADRTRAICDSIRPAPIVLPVIIYLALSIVHLGTVYGLWFTIAQIVLGAVILIGGNILVARVAPTVSRVGVRITAMTLGYTAIAVVSSFGTMILQEAFGTPVHFYWSPVFYYPVTAIMLAGLEAAGRRRALDEDALAALVSRQVQLGERVHQRLLHTRRHVAHILHSTVQGELVAHALVLRSQPSAHDGPALERQVRTVLANTLARAERALLEDEDPPVGTARAQISGVLGAWGRVVRLSTEIDQQVWDQLERQSDRVDAVIEVLSEGFTNAIRHGDGPEILVRMQASRASDASLKPDVDADPRWVTVSISSPGRLHDSTGEGIGLARLGQLVREVVLREDGDAVVLRAVV